MSKIPFDKLIKMPKDQLKKLRIERHMNDCIKPIPKGYVDFVNEEVLQSFLFYNNDTHEAYCTHCRKVVGVPKMKHNTHTKCPECGHPVIAKSQKISHKKPIVTWSVLTQKKDGIIVFRHFRHTQNMVDYENPIAHTIELYREVADGKNRVLYMFWSGKWQEYKRRGWWNMNSYTSIWWIPQDESIYRFKHLNELLKGTPYQYCCFQEMIRIDRGFWMCKYLEMYLDSPYLEQLIKVGFYKIAQACMIGYLRLENGKTIMETLGIDKIRYKQLLKVGNPSTNDLEILQQCEYGITDENYKYLRETVSNAYQLRRFEDTVGDVNRIVAYLKKQSITLDLYADYVTNLSEMNYPMDKSYLYPKNFRDEHNRVYHEVLDKREKAERERIEKMDKAIQLLKERKEELYKRITSFRENGLIAVLPTCVEDLKREGRVLHHCVGTYGNRVAEGKTVIIFIRKEECPDEPYYTLEWKGYVEQCRGSHNCDPTEEVAQFRDDLARYITIESI